MKAELTIDIHGLTSVRLTPDTKAERLILERMAECKEGEIVRHNRLGQYLSYQERDELASLTVTELRGPKVEKSQ